MELWVDSKQEQDMSLFSKVFRPLLGNTQPAIQQVLEAVSLGQSMNLTTHLYLESKFKKCEDISPLPLTSHWHKDNFFFTILNKFITFWGCRSGRGSLPSDTRIFKMKIVEKLLSMYWMSLEYKKSKIHS